MNDRTYDIFLSYPHADRAEVMQICKGEISGSVHFLWFIECAIRIV